MVNSCSPPAMGTRPVGFELGIAAGVVGDDGLFQPAEMEGLEQREHALGVVERPAHVGVGHEVDAVADDFADGADEFDVASACPRRRRRGPSRSAASWPCSPASL